MYKYPWTGKTNRTMPTQIHTNIKTHLHIYTHTYTYSTHLQTMFPLHTYTSTHPGTHTSSVRWSVCLCVLQQVKRDVQVWCAVALAYQLKRPWLSCNQHLVFCFNRVLTVHTVHMYCTSIFVNKHLYIHYNSVAFPSCDSCYEPTMSYNVLRHTGKHKTQAILLRHVQNSGRLCLCSTFEVFYE